MGKWDKYKKNKTERTDEKILEQNTKLNINCLTTVFPILLKKLVK